MLTHSGELAALVAAIFWTFTALAFESASKRIGSLSVNLLRLAVAFILFGLLGLLRTGSFWPEGADLHNWFWLSLSGLIGFVIGDLFLFQAFVVVGARISMLIMSMAPPIAAFIGWVILGEKIGIQGYFGMLLTLSGIAMVILVRNTDNRKEGQELNKSVRLKYPIWGILLALGGAFGQAIGLVLSKYGMKDYDVIMATQIRVITGAIGFTVIFTFLNKWVKIKLAFNDRKALGFLAIGTVFGPFLGVTFSLFAVKYALTGIASSIMSIVPVLIIPPAIIFFKEKVSIKEVIGACLAIAGVVLFFV